MPEIRKIEIKQATFERLQHHAEPLIDSVDLVLNRALDALEEKATTPPPGPVGTDPDRLPDLTHTKVLVARISGEKVEKPTWNGLLRLVLGKAMDQLRDVDELQRLCRANVVAGRKEDEGYHYQPKAGISVQGFPANEACEALVAAAQGLGIGVDVEFH